MSDKLRDLLLNPESSSADIYTPDERQELLFCIFEHLCLGGAVNQFEVNSCLHDLCDGVGCPRFAQTLHRANQVAHSPNPNPACCSMLEKRRKHDAV